MKPSQQFVMGGREHEHSKAKVAFLMRVHTITSLSEIQMNYVNRYPTLALLVRNVRLTTCPFEFLDIAAYGKSDFIFEEHGYYILLS